MRAEPLVSFYGDSYTEGIGASDPEHRWSTILCSDRGWTEHNPSLNGLGFVRNRAPYGADLPGDIIAATPDIVIVTMGLNDNFAFDESASDIRRQISADFDRMHSALPDARIVVIEPFWYTDARPVSVDLISGWIADAATAIGAEHIGGASHWIENHPQWMATDGLHPNDSGYAQIASRMDVALARLGL